MERLAMLKQKLAEKNEARIRRAFAADPELQSMQEQLALKERQYNTAAAGGLKDDARALEKQVKTLRTEIESRQDLLTTADGVAPDMKDLEAFITDTLARMEKDRARNDRIMADHLKELTAKAPAAGSLPAEQKAFAEQLERRQAELNKAREGYAAAVEAAAAEADEDVKSLEAELAAVQAKLDERKKQVAEAARNTLPEDQQRERVALTEASRRALDAAQKADEEAAAAYLANRRSLADAEAQLERVQGQASSFDRENAKAAEASRRVVAVGDEVDQLRRRLDAAIVPVKPTDEHVAVAPQGPDRRVIYVLGTCLVLALVYGPLVAAAPLHPKPQEPAGETLELVDSFDGGVHGFGTVPFAAPAARDADEPALAAARAMEDATDDQHGRRPGGSAVPV
jgi:chromosome segregation ATPase